MCKLLYVWECAACISLSYTCIPCFTAQWQCYDDGECQVLGGWDGTTVAICRTITRTLLMFLYSFDLFLFPLLPFFPSKEVQVVVVTGNLDKFVILCLRKTGLPIWSMGPTLVDVRESSYPGLNVGPTWIWSLFKGLKVWQLWMIIKLKHFYDGGGFVWYKLILNQRMRLFNLPPAEWLAWTEVGTIV